MEEERVQQDESTEKKDLMAGSKVVSVCFPTGSSRLVLPIELEKEMEMLGETGQGGAPRVLEEYSSTGK